MSSPTILASQLIDAGSAANADQLGDNGSAAAPSHLPTGGDQGIEGTGSWDAYEVWRRFIRDPRDRRKQPPTN